MGRHVFVGVEAQDGIGLRQLLSQTRAVPLREAADRHHCLGATALLEISGFQEGIDRVLLGLFHEPAGVHHRHIGFGCVADQRPPLRLQPSGELFGVDLIAGAPQGDEGDTTLTGHPDSLRPIQKSADCPYVGSSVLMKYLVLMYADERAGNQPPRRLSGGT